MKIYITENQFLRYIKFLNKNKKQYETLVKKISSDYSKFDGDEIGLPFDIYLKEENKNNKNKLYCYAVYSNDKSFLKKYLVQYDLEIKNNEQDEYMRLFINNNIEPIYKLSTGEYDMFDFFKNITHIDNQFYGLINDTNIICEMSRIKSTQTGLATDIWVDECGTYKKGKHYQRLKFNPNNGDENSHNFPSLTLTKEPTLISNNIKINLSNNDINQIKEFIKLNLENLIKLGNGEIKKNTDFIPNMISFDKSTGKIIYPTDKNETNYYVHHTDNIGFNYFKLNNSEKYNFSFGKNINPLCRFWFDNLTNFYYRNNELVAYGVINNMPYDVYPDGTIKSIK